jgi:hypothetical protein
MSKTSRVATAVAAGYVLGRFKKLRMAVMVGSAMANDNVRNAALNYVKKGSGGLVPTSAGGTLTQQIGSKLLDAGKAAAVSAAASRVDSFSDRLASRSESLRGTNGDEPTEGEPEAEYESDEYEDEAVDEDEGVDEDEEDAEEDEDVEEPVTRSSRRRRSSSPARSGA